MTISRRAFLATAIGAGLARGASANSPRVVLAAASREGPHAAAAEAIEQYFASRSIPTATFQLPSGDPSFRQAIGAAGHQLTIAVGAEAARVASALGSHIPLLAAMVFRSDLENVHPSGAVWLDIPVTMIATGLRTVFPSACRAAVVRDPSQSDPDDPSQARALPPGFNLRSVDCRNASDLLTAMRQLRGQVEFLICRPDSNLYNKTTVEPLILASLEHKLPLVGYSASFVRAGAAVGVYPDFAEIGRQTAQLAERFLSGAAPLHDEYPKRTTVSANERVLHLLGKSFRSAAGEVVIVR